MTIEDIKVVHNFVSDSEVPCFNRWSSMNSLEETANYVEEMIKRKSSISHIYANVINKTSNKIVDLY